MAKKAKYKNIKIVSFGTNKKSDIYPLSIKKNNKIKVLSVKLGKKIVKVEVEMPNSVTAGRSDSRIEALTEIKRSPLHPKVEEEKSEFERARSLSKTWSMPQD